MTSESRGWHCYKDQPGKTCLLRRQHLHFFGSQHPNNSMPRWRSIITAMLLIKKQNTLYTPAVTAQNNHNLMSIYRSGHALCPTYSTFTSILQIPFVFPSSFFIAFCPSLISKFQMARHKLTPRRVITKVDAFKPISTMACVTPPDRPPTEVFTSSTGVRGEMLRLGVLAATPTLKTRHMHVVFLPGNPCLIEYYRPLLRRLYQRLPHDAQQAVTVHGLGLPGHDLRELNGMREFIIQDHLEYCVEYLKSELVVPGVERSEVVVVGHSYGCFLGLKVIKMLKLEGRAGYVMLMPALYRMAECAGSVMRLMLQDSFRMTTWGAWTLTALTPPLIRDAVIRALKHESGVEPVSKKLVDGRRRGLYLNICSLARDEMAKILDPASEKVSELGRNSLLVYADGDRWCPPEGRERIQKALGDGLQVEFAGEDVNHAFVLSGDETEKLVRIVAPWLSELVRKRRAEMKTKPSRNPSWVVMDGVETVPE